MIKTVINLAGEEEEFDAKKLNHWVQDTVGKIKINDWTAIAQEAIAELPEVCTVQQLMSSLIDMFLKRETWTHYLLAGKLMAVLIRIEIFGSKDIPTIREVQQRLIDKKLMRHLKYSDYELAELEKAINHDLDLMVPHFALEQVRLKYSLQDFSEKLEFETMQFVYMRMAMTVFETHEETVPNTAFAAANAPPGKRTRLEHVIRMYNHFAKKRLSAPTPNYNNLGTFHRGFASCCLIAAGDDRFSLAAADHITYMMTTQSAGIGLNIMCRSIGDAVQQGRFLHRGKKPYIDVFGKNIRANLQGGRGGAGTFYANLYDPEARMIFGLRDTRAVETKRNRDAHYAFMSNRFLTMKAGNEEQVFAWNCYTAPELHEAFYNGDIHKFAEIYTRLEADESFEKVYFDARELLLFALTQGVSTGTIYAASIDEMNRNTPFLDPILSSNLCVAPGTEILTRKGPEAISTYQDRHVEVWNGFEWSGVTVRKTADKAKLVRVYLDQGKGYIDCTLYHKWYVLDKMDFEVQVRTHELKKGMRIAGFYMPRELDNPVHPRVLDIEDLGVENSTYCFNEPIRHKAMFNGVVTGQCLEVSEPTQPYSGRFAMQDLQSDKEVGYAIFEATNTAGKVLKFATKASDVLKPIAGQKWVAQSVKVGYTFWTEQDGPLTVSKVIDVKKEPEVALCSLASINVTDEISDEDYRDVMYYAYKMIDYCILENDYILPHMGVTAKARMNAGVGMMGLATHMARRRLKFNEKAGLEELHRVFERHLYYAIEASLQISTERGLAPWIERTKWPEGWTPLQTYRKEVDELGDFVYQYDHEEQRQRIIANGGLAHSCLINFMPGESSSKALGATNSIYGIRKAIMIKTDANNVLRWAAPYSDDPSYEYQSMWDLELIEQNSIYAIAQKFCDQTVSADWYLNFMKRVVIRSSMLLDAEIDRVRKGVKTRYYINTLMPDGGDAMKISKSAHDYAWQVFSDGFRAAYTDALAKEIFAGSCVDFAKEIASLQAPLTEAGYDWSVLADEASMVLSVMPAPEAEPEAAVDDFSDLADLGIVFENEDDRVICDGCGS
jgi:ribonucleotide reductase alpha subunit